MPKPKIEPEPGAASILVVLSDSKVTVRHGDHQTASYGILVRPHKVHKGFGDGLFAYLNGRDAVKPLKGDR